MAYSLITFLLAEFLFPKMESSKKMDATGTLQPNPPLKLQPDRSAGSVLVPEQGGYKEKFVKTVEDKYKCEKCRLVLCNPKQTECGHRFCESCMAALLRWVLHTGSDCPACLNPSLPASSKTLNDFQSSMGGLRTTQARLTPQFLRPLCLALPASHPTCPGLSPEVSQWCQHSVHSASVTQWLALYPQSFCDSHLPCCILRRKLMFFGGDVK